MDKTETASIKEQVYEALHEVYDPELGVNVVDLGLIYDLDVSADGFLTIIMTLTTPGCPLHESISEGIGVALQDVPGLTAGEIRLVWDPPWSPERMTAEGRRQLGL
jgi:metal-sulfur cluster biosynthetic enzyme